ncbi:murein biosynthesis integral membrane protein MurJ [Falsibacillus pallidus]|uniref:Putative peptidoglycan lipid II flippase n=1 Tax=Falsibacillus pallidus TaxID=493781 RepID=A0A370G8Q1_9BACI|nr:oligosaccharide flippase family protein [Falsibacillus pallidus]RDI40162.1 putative peptidoglycan lipid II flippase [Falsibacillus pallidus]
MSSLKKTAIWITLLALVLKLSGFLRESIMAKQFGANHYTDGYILAFSFVTLVVAMIQIGFNNVFLPLYMKNLKVDNDLTERNANGILNSTIVVFLVISVVGAIFVPYFVPFIYGHMHPTTEVVAVKTTRLFFIFLSLIAVTGILDSYLQAKRSFVPSQTSKLLATLVGALFALLFSGIWGIYSLAYGFIFGTFLGILIQFYYLLKKGYRWSPTLRVEKEFRKTFIALIIPALLNSVVGQVNMFVDKTFSSGSISGAVTYLNNASLIVSIPNAIYATTIAAIIFTLLSEQIDQKEKFQNTFFMGMEISLVTLAPIAAGLWVVGDSAIAFIYQHGQFSAKDTANTYVALINYLPLIVTQGLQFIVSKSMYAREKTAVVLRISVTTILLNVVLDYFFMKWLGYPGLALASSIVSVYFLAVSAIVVYKDFDKGEANRLWSLLIRVFIPTLIMALPLFGVKEWTSIGSLYPVFQLAILVPAGVVLYAVSLRFIYREGFNRLLGILKKKRKA